MVTVNGMLFAEVTQDVELEAKLEDMSVGEHSQHLLNVCLRNANQGIGRVIRHAKDCACILPCDTLYYNKRVKSKLPKFVESSMKYAN